jgi:beta-glucuronidase
MARSARNPDFPNRFHPQNQEGWKRKGLVSDKGQRKKAWRVMKEFYEGK